MPGSNYAPIPPQGAPAAPSLGNGMSGLGAQILQSLNPMD
jgi:hypothetical protein